MNINSTAVLSKDERDMRRWGAIGTVCASLLIIWIRLGPNDFTLYVATLKTVAVEHLVMAFFYGVFALWCMAHLDVIGDRVFGGRVGRRNSLRLGFISRAFGFNGCWSKALRENAWYKMRRGHQPARLKAIVRISNGAFVFGLYCSFLLTNLAYPQFFSALLGFDASFVRFLFIVLVAGSLILAWQRSTALWLERCLAATLVGLCLLCAAFTIYELNAQAFAASFGEVWVVMVLATGLGWLLRVPFTFGVLEVSMLILAAPDQLGAALAGITLFHICFQGPGLITALVLSHWPEKSVPLLLGDGGKSETGVRSRDSGDLARF